MNSVPSMLERSNMFCGENLKIYSVSVTNIGMWKYIAIWVLLVEIVSNSQHYTVVLHRWASLIKGGSEEVRK